MGRRVVLVCACLFVCANAHADPLVVVDTSGHFVGVDGIMLNGAAYNVALETGSCASVFGDCDETHFMFGDRDTAREARIALDNVIWTTFHDAVNPETEGGTLWSLAVAPLIATPYEIDPGSGVVVTQTTFWYNSPTGKVADFIPSATIGSVVSHDYPDNTSEFVCGQYAVWTAVPEPDTNLLLLVGVLGVLAVRRFTTRPRATN